MLALHNPQSPEITGGYSALCVREQSSKCTQLDIYWKGAACHRANYWSKLPLAISPNNCARDQRLATRWKSTMTSIFLRLTVLLVCCRRRTHSCQFIPTPKHPNESFFLAFPRISPHCENSTAGALKALEIGRPQLLALAGTRTKQSERKWNWAVEVCLSGHWELLATCRILWLELHQMFRHIGKARYCEPVLRLVRNTCNL